MKTLALTLATTIGLVTGTSAQAQADTIGNAQLVSNCLVCHNDMVESVPDPRGFSATSISKKLIGYRDDSVEGTIMNRIAKGLNDEQIAVISKAMSRM